MEPGQLHPTPPAQGHTGSTDRFWAGGWGAVPIYAYGYRWERMEQQLGGVGLGLQGANDQLGLAERGAYAALIVSWRQPALFPPSCDSASAPPLAGS